VGHVPGVVHHDVDTALLGGDRPDRRVHRDLVLDVHLDAAGVDALGRRQCGELRDSLGVTAGGGAHAGVHDVPRAGEGPGGEVAEAARGAGDDDDLGASHAGDFPISRAGRWR
jgi:hypothetical protein